MFRTLFRWIQTITGPRPPAPSEIKGQGAPLPPPAKPSAVRRGLASSFADPADIAAFSRCKAAGGTDQACFKIGDNGIGCWGDDTTAPRPMCALPREDWAPLGSKARGARVYISANGRTIQAELRDTMPARKNIKNGAIIDLNPAACAALALTPPMLVLATWTFA